MLHPWRRFLKILSSISNLADSTLKKITSSSDFMNWLLHKFLYFWVLYYLRVSAYIKISFTPRIQLEIKYKQIHVMKMQLWKHSSCRVQLPLFVFWLHHLLAGQPLASYWPFLCFCKLRLVIELTHRVVKINRWKALKADPETQHMLNNCLILVLYWKA